MSPAATPFRSLLDAVPDLFTLCLKDPRDAALRIVRLQLAGVEVLRESQGQFCDLLKLSLLHCEKALRGAAPAAGADAP